MRAFTILNSKIVPTTLLIENCSVLEAMALGFLRISGRWLYGREGKRAIARGVKNDEAPANVPVVLTAQGRKELARLSALEKKRAAR
jgi:hypothetical protein